LNNGARPLNASDSEGTQAAGLPLFSIETDDCMREYRTGVLMKDLYGYKIYLNQD
jgi:hypothetical protein